jgi:DNA-binding response OmpR family regulator
LPAPPRVLVLSVDRTLSQLVQLNLERRGFDVRQHGWAACCGLGEAPRPCAANLVVADLDCPSPACWNGTPRLRAVFPSHPLLLLAHERPSAPYLQTHQPCRSLQKPFAIDELVQAVSGLILMAG